MKSRSADRTVAERLKAAKLDALFKKGQRTGTRDSAPKRGDSAPERGDSAPERGDSASAIRD